MHSTKDSTRQIKVGCWRGAGEVRKSFQSELLVTCIVQGPTLTGCTGSKMLLIAVMSRVSRVSASSSYRVSLPTTPAPPSYYRASYYRHVSCVSSASCLLNHAHSMSQYRMQCGSQMSHVTLHRNCIGTLHRNCCIRKQDDMSHSRLHWYATSHVSVCSSV